MNFKVYIPVLILCSVFLFEFLFTTYSFKDEIKGIVLSDFINYKTTEGKITNSGTQLETGRYSSRLIIDVRYAYEVNSIPYTSKLINFAADYHKIDYYLEKYPHGKKVLVHYEINNPSFAVLEPDTKDWTVLFLPFVWILFGGLIFLVLYMSTKISWLKELMEWIHRSAR